MILVTYWLILSHRAFPMSEGYGRRIGELGMWRYNADIRREVEREGTVQDSYRTIVIAGNHGLLLDQTYDEQCSEHDLADPSKYLAQLGKSSWGDITYLPMLSM
jgi:hypothetical protein